MKSSKESAREEAPPAEAIGSVGAENASARDEGDGARRADRLDFSIFQNDSQRNDRCQTFEID